MEKANIKRALTKKQHFLILALLQVLLIGREEMMKMRIKKDLGGVIWENIQLRRLFTKLEYLFLPGVTNLSEGFKTFKFSIAGINTLEIFIHFYFVKILLLISILGRKYKGEAKTSSSPLWIRQNIKPEKLFHINNYQFLTN